MRWLALAPMLVATGCNWIYGLDPTIAVDGAISELPPASRTKLVWAIATTDGMPVPPGIDPELIYKPIGSEMGRPQPPTILVGDDGALSPAAYDMIDGSFEIPNALRESPHRIVYTLPGESVPHEVQWALTGAYLVVPRTTRFDAPAVPTGSGYTITPMGLGTQLVAPSLYTSGAFAYSTNGGDFEQTVPGTLTFRFAQDARTLTSPAGAPQGAKGDWVLLLEFQSRTAQQSSVDAWALTKLELQPNMMTAPGTEPMWINPTTDRVMTTLLCPGTECVPTLSSGSAAQRLHAVLGAGGTDSTFLVYGVSPSTDLPGFLPGVAPTYVDRPLVMPLLESTRFDGTLTVADPSPELGLERVLSARASLSRVVSGVTLISSLQAITNKLETNGLPFAAPLAINATLGTTSLSGDTDAVPHPASSSMQRLTFGTEATFSAHDFVITLYELSGTSLAPVRVYHVLAPEVKVDGSLLVTGHHYVFGITARKGFPSIDRGDYGKALYPFAATTTFVRTFVVQ